MLAFRSKIAPTLVSTARRTAAATKASLPRPYHRQFVLHSRPLVRLYSSSSSEATQPQQQEELVSDKSEQDHHAVVSTFDLFSIGVGPSSSHTVGPMRAAKIFINDLKEHKVLDRIHTLRVGMFIAFIIQKPVENK